MSTEPLLPSYASATWQHGDYTVEGVINATTPIIQGLSFLIFVGTAIVSTVWACRSNINSHLAPPASAPLLPYFASLCLLISFSCWIGYIIFISREDHGGPRFLRNFVIGTSVFGKLILACAHIGFWLSYKYSFPDSAQPNWVIVFLAAQAWWDVLLLLVYSCLRLIE